MRVVMLQQISGTRDGAEWPPVGGEIELPEAEAADLFQLGLARPAPTPAPEPTPEPEPVERAVVEEPAEQAVVPQRVAKRPRRK